MTNGEAINWIINISADIGKAEHRDLWHYEQALSEIRDMLESAQPEIIHCRECKHYYFADNRIPQEQRYVCDIGGEVWQPDDYCSYAERRENSNENKERP